MEETKPMSITSLIAIPALITLGITVLRLAGELEHWPAPWFSTAAGGGLALLQTGDRVRIDNGIVYVNDERLPYTMPEFETKAAKPAHNIFSTALLPH